MQISPAGHTKIIRFLLLFAIILAACDRIYYPPYPQDEKWSFVVLSDTRLGYHVFGNLSRNIGALEPSPRAAFCCGDIVDYSTSEASWLTFKDSARAISEKMPLFLVRGNHDGNDTISEKLFRRFADLGPGGFYYTHSEENTLFIILDNWERGKTRAILGDQFKWLQDQLDSSSADTSVSNIFLFMHQLPYPQGKHSGENLTNADELHQLFLQHNKIRAVFAGHDHMFNKYVKDGIVYITTGGGGSPLYSGYGGDYHHFLKVTFCKESDRINVRTVDLSNETIDCFDL